VCAGRELEEQETIRVPRVVRAPYAVDRAFDLLGEAAEKLPHFYRFRRRT